MCKRCGLILKHLYSIKQETSANTNGASRKVSRYGTTTITRYLETKGCRNTVMMQKQKGIIRGFV